MVGFIFDASQGESPKTLALKRALAAQIMGAIGNRPARNAPEGIGNALASIGQGISANVLGRRADDAEKAGNAGANSLYNQLISGLTGGGMSGAGSSGSSGLGSISGGASGSGAPAIVSTDPVASGLEPEQAALLNGIAGPESAGKYNVRYTPSGGTNFSGFDRHPGIAEMGPEGPSTAAGRYQFTKTTWDGLPAAVKGDGTFSPENQDRAALYLAGQDYQKRTGRDLNADIKQNGMTPAIAAALGPTWTGLKTNARSAIANYDQSLSRYDHQQDAAQDSQMGEGPAVDMASLPAPVRTVMGGGGGTSAQPTQTAGAGPVNVMSDDEIDAQFDPVTARSMKAIAAGVRGQQGQTAPGKPVQVASLGNVANDASPPGAFGGAPAQPAFSPFAPEFNRDPSQFRQPAPQMAAMPLGMMSGGAFSGDATGSIPPQAQPQPQPAPQPRSPFLPQPAPPPAEAAPQPSPMPQRSPFLPPQMTPSTFEEAPGTLPGGGQIPPQLTQAQPQPPQQAILPQAPDLPTQTPNLQAATAQQPGQPQAGGMAGIDLPTLMKAASNPFLMGDPGKAATIQALIKQKLEQQDPLYQGRLQALPLDMQAKRLAVAKAEREMQGGDFQKRSEAAARFGIDPNSYEGKQFILTGKLPSDESGDAKVVGGRLVRYKDGVATDITPGTVGKTPAGNVNLSNLPAVPLDQRGVPDAAIQKEFLNGLDPAVASLVKGIADYRIPIEKVTSLRGNQRQELAQVVSQFDPTFDMSQYGARAAMRKSITSGTYSQLLNSSNLVIQHLDALSKAADKLGNSSFTPWNSVVNEGKNLTGNPDITAFNTAKSAAAAELAKVFKGTGASSVQEIQDWMQNISSSAAPAQTKAMINMAVKDLLKSRIDTIRNQYGAAMGKPSEFSFLTPHSREVLQGLGVDPSELDTGPAPQASASPATAPVKAGSQEEYNALPSGTQFQAPDGSIRRKP